MIKQDDGDFDAVLQEQLELFRGMVQTHALESVELFDFTPPVKAITGVARLALVLSGCHQIMVHHHGQIKKLNSFENQAVFFSPSASNLNTNAVARHVVTILFMKEVTQLNFVRHDGVVEAPSNLQIHRIEQPMDVIGRSIVQTLTHLSQHPRSAGRALPLTQALLLSVVDALDVPCPNSRPEKAILTWHRVQSYLEENTQTDLRRDNVATLFKLSPNYVSTLCRRQTGKSFGEVVTALRLAKACLLLQDKSMTLAVVSFYCGYEDTSYFIRVFKQGYGMTPGQYRCRYDVDG